MTIKRKHYFKGQIVRYWINWENDNKDIPPWGDWDPGEPTCMACGYWDEKWDITHVNLETRWNKCTLQKCHVIPLYLGGIDEVSNMVLMCDKCHKNHPDSTNAQDTYEFMLNRGFWDRPDALIWSVALGFAGKELQQALIDNLKDNNVA